ncbi:MAG: carbon-nitrogen hydrolase family protein [Deltaproteobacteria bacterium]|nr:carbon-nitrogen hydrolase family protein [Deltaproteobacteria bacterium]
MGDSYPKFKAASVQAAPVFLDRKATVEKACQLMKEASRNGAKLVAFPETFVPGYPYWIWLDVPSDNYAFFQKLFEEAVVIPGAATEELCHGAREADVYVVIGVNEKLGTQMGTMWNTNLLIDNQGNILGKHRKLVPTFAEKMIWSRGDGSGLRVWETDLGILGTLACGNNTHSLYRYALIAQGEQIHIANYPAFNVPGEGDLAQWNLIRTGAHSLEGKLFNICSSSAVSAQMIEMLCGDVLKKKDWMKGCRSYSSITNPAGNTLAELTDDEGIIYADIDVAEMITQKQFHDIIGHYSRMDVVSLNLCQHEDQPLRYETRTKNGAMRERPDWELIENLVQNQQFLLHKLKRIEDAILKDAGGATRVNEED